MQSLVRSNEVLHASHPCYYCPYYETHGTRPDLERPESSSLRGRQDWRQDLMVTMLCSRGQWTVRCGVAIPMVTAEWGP